MHTDDIVLMGRQQFKFRELAKAMTTAKVLGLTMQDLTHALEEPVAALIQLNASGETPSKFPLLADEVLFGRTRAPIPFLTTN